MTTTNAILDARKPDEDIRDFIRRLANERTPSRSGAAAKIFKKEISEGRANAILEGWDPDEIDEILLAMVADGRVTNREATTLAVVMAKTFQ
jgi:hypothetical protein